MILIYLLNITINASIRVGNLSKYKSDLCKYSCNMIYSDSFGYRCLRKF